MPISYSIMSSGKEIFQLIRLRVGPEPARNRNGTASAACPCEDANKTFFIG